MRLCLSSRCSGQRAFPAVALLRPRTCWTWPRSPILGKCWWRSTWCSWPSGVASCATGRRGLVSVRWRCISLPRSASCPGRRQRFPPRRTRGLCHGLRRVDGWANRVGRGQRRLCSGAVWIGCWRICGTIGGTVAATGGEWFCGVASGMVAKFAIRVVGVVRALPILLIKLRRCKSLQY